MLCYWSWSLTQWNKTLQRFYELEIILLAWIVFYERRKNFLWIYVSHSRLQYSHDEGYMISCLLDIQQLFSPRLDESLLLWKHKLKKMKNTIFSDIVNRRQTDRVSMLVMHSDNDSFPPGFSTPQVTLEIVADNEVSGSRRISAAGQHYYSWSRGPCQKLIRTTSNLLHTGLIIFQINSLSSFIIDTICDLHFLPFLCPKLGFDT